MKVLIIEDEARSAKELERIILAVDPDMEILAVLESVELAIKWFRDTSEPDVIFSDIQLADGLSFEIFEKIKIACPVIFCTAYDEYLMNAFETNAISYLLKPIDKNKVQKGLDKLKFLQQSSRQEHDISSIAKLLKQVKNLYKSTLLVNHREKIIPVAVREIGYICMDGTIIQICTFQNQKYFTISSLDELEKGIDPKLFYRANRQFLISRRAISSVERFFSRKLAVKLLIDTPETVLVSKGKANEFLKWLENGEE